MKQRVTKDAFVQAFDAAGRAEDFTRNALIALFERLEEVEAMTGDENEIDALSLCAQYGEFETKREAATHYGWEPPDHDEDATEAELEIVHEEAEQAAGDWLNDRTTVIGFGGGYVVARF